ncbi:hypothetical protein C8R42DRAFT_549626, partial [Lentinula raphanica]
ISDEKKKKLQELWLTKRYLIIDELSMLSKTFITKLNDHISTGVRGTDHFITDSSFGGPKRSAMYFQHHPTDTLEMRLGRQIYEEFSVVVLLQEQMRVTDIIWRAFLTRLRYGRVTDEDVEMLNGMVLNKGTALVTPRHGVRKLWNSEAVREHCRKKHVPLYRIAAEDTIGGRSLMLKEQIEVARRGSRNNTAHKNGLPTFIEIVVGMKVMVTSNVETDLDVTNGARGEIVDIILDPREESATGEQEIALEFLPKYVLVKMDRTQ